MTPGPPRSDQQHAVLGQCGWHSVGGGRGRQRRRLTWPVGTWLPQNVTFPPIALPAVPHLAAAAGRLPPQLPPARAARPCHAHACARAAPGLAWPPLPPTHIHAHAHAPPAPASPGPHPPPPLPPSLPPSAQVLVCLFPIGIFAGGLMQLDYLLCPSHQCDNLQVGRGLRGCGGREGGSGGARAGADTRPGHPVGDDDARPGQPPTPTPTPGNV